MKNFINIVVTLTLIFFAIGITYLQVCNPTHVWFLLYGLWMLLAIGFWKDFNKQ